ncbi:MAG: hypothetical protein DRI52_07030 [Chloroflexi bacterium]|nr:MAG: hypothetical protein DRI52_07030 [Chloroflexota bacterium]
MVLKELIHNMGCLQEQLLRFEEKYGVKSPEFYQAMMSGELEDFDALDEYRMEFVEWLALYKTWLSLEQKYRQLIARQPVSIQIKTAVAA